MDNTNIKIDEKSSEKKSLQGLNNKEMDSSSVDTEIKLTPEWFKAHSNEFEGIRDEAKSHYKDFKSKFAPEVLSTLSGEELLIKMFYSRDYNNDNLCYYLEHGWNDSELFGEIKGRSALNFNLYYERGKSSWKTGSPRYPKLISSKEAIALGTKIRDAIVKGAEIIKANRDISDAEGYNKLYSQLSTTIGKYVNLMFVLKYYHLLFPDMFATFYNEDWQYHVLNKIDIEPFNSRFVRMGQISLFAKECDIENVVFGQIINKYYPFIKDKKKEGKVKGISNKTSNTELQTLSPRQKKVMPLNFILYGAPGTGKTYATAEYAMVIIENCKVDLSQKTSEQRAALMAKYIEATKAGRITFTTFHQSYGYEDFVQGLRPDTKQGGFNFVSVDGVFKKIADEAIKHRDQNYVIIIDEINRANISKVFGELITLIEGDKRWGEINALSVTLPSGEHFKVPNNLFIVGTMNSADKSISLIDAALRRRFDFIEVVPNADIVENTTLKIVLTRLNDELYKELDSTDLLVGHAYFIGKTEEDLCDIMNHSIIPLLYEYFYDNTNKVKNILDKTIAGYNFQVSPAKVGRLRLGKK
ncbi:McrB family protein [Mycoplasma corogypsi]|uniref:McrB family protein n=1 Tax=Mycoplasma corogypsi TaxID=2106 RepID=UPI0038739204